VALLSHLFGDASKVISSFERRQRGSGEFIEKRGFCAANSTNAEDRGFDEEKAPWSRQASDPGAKGFSGVPNLSPIVVTE
jgi:hypothetical protein